MTLFHTGFTIKSPFCESRIYPTWPVDWFPYYLGLQVFLPVDYQSGRVTPQIQLLVTTGSVHSEVLKLRKKWLNFLNNEFFSPSINLNLWL